MEQGVDHPELVAHLGATEYGDERVPGALEQPRQHLNLTEQQATTGVGQHRGWTHDRGVLAVRRPERLVHVVVAELGQVDAERRIVRGLACLEAQVLDHHDVARARRGDDRLDARTDHCRGEQHLGAEQLTQPPGDRSHREHRIRLALGSPEMPGDHDHRAAFAQPRDGGQRARDAQVVLDVAVEHGHVEIDAHQHPLTAAERQVFEAREVAGTRQVAGHRYVAE